MFHDLFNRYLKRSQGYERLKDRLRDLEKEVKDLHQVKQTQSSAPPPSPTMRSINFPPTITINVNKKDNASPIKTYTTKKRPKRIQEKSAETEAKAPILKQVKQESLPEKTPQKNPEPSPSHPTYIEFLNVEQIVIDRYEQSNNFGALGIKSLEGKLNIGANYGDKSQLPEDVQKKLEKKLKDAEAWKSFKPNKEATKDTQVSEDMPPKASEESHPWEASESFEHFPDWDDFFTHQPSDAENNQQGEKD